MSTTSQAYQSRCHRLALATEGNLRAGVVNDPNCKCVIFKKRGGKQIGIYRCANRKLKAHNRRQCRAGKGKSFRQRRFVPCK